LIELLSFIDISNHWKIARKKYILIDKQDCKQEENMCLGIPSKIISIENSNAKIDVYGAQRDISLLLLEEPVNIGDYVIVHAGFAIQKLQEDVAKETLGYFDQYLQALAVEEGMIEQPVKKTKAKTKKKS
jgi:hydrogenase expression/formation protein HypC